MSKVKYHISRDFMTFGVEFQLLGGFGVGIAFWDARPMEMMIIVPFYSALGGFGIMLKTIGFHWFIRCGGGCCGNVTATLIDFSKII